MTSDPFNLVRFLRAQDGTYATALSEIRAGRKLSHWMWFIFPQFAGLGFSENAGRYSIKSLAEAEAYLAHPVLGPRLIESAQAALAVEGRSVLEIFGAPDDVKLRSCATLFALVSGAGSVFEKVLEKYFGGARDRRTLELVDVSRQSLVTRPIEDG